jgi:hypothetical protein
MRGLLAVISHDRKSSVPEADMDGLAAAFVSLRGAGKLFRANAGEFARVIRISSSDHSGLETDGASWVAAYGLVHQENSRLFQPVERIDGQFSLISYDSSTREVQVAADPLGLQALYLADRNGRTYVCTSALALAKHLHAKPHRFGIEVFLRAGYHFGDLTNWEGIERLAPGTVIEFSESDVRRRTYWRPQIDETIAKLGFEQAADHWIEVAVDTFRAYLDVNRCYCVNLTGGYDSRLLNLLLHRAGVRIRANTRGDERDLDVRIGGRIAQTAGWEWLNIRLPDEWTQVQPDMARVALAWGDGHLEVINLAEALWQPPALGLEPILFNGGGGELLRNFAWQQEFLSAGKSNRVHLDRWIDMRLLHTMDTSVLAHDPTPAVRADFGRRMRQWVRPYESNLNTTQLDMMYAYKCTGHFGLYGPAFGVYGLVQSPLFFKPVFNAATSIRWQHRNGHALMRQIIHRLNPTVARIATTSGGPAQPMRLVNLHRFLPYYANIGLKAVNKLSEKAVGRRLLSKPSAIHPRLVAARDSCISGGGHGTNRWAGACGMRSAALYNKSRLNALLRRAQSPGFQEAALVGRILTVEMALEAIDAYVDA